MFFVSHNIHTTHTAGDSLRHHYSTPLTRLQKLENVQICLRYLKQKGMSIAGINPEGEKNETFTILNFTLSVLDDISIS